jgi:hypothetical protein
MDRFPALAEFSGVTGYRPALVAVLSGSYDKGGEYIRKSQHVVQTSKQSGALST